MPHRSPAGCAFRCRYDRDLRRRISGRCRRCLRKAAKEVKIVSLPCAVCVVQGFLVAENMAFCACEMQQNGEKTFFSVFLLFCQRFKKQGSVPFFSFIFRFVKRSQLFICFFEAFSAFSLLSNPQESFIIIKRSAAISRPVCKNGNPGSSQSVLAARPLCGGPGGLVFFKFYRVIGKRSILLC